MLDENGSKGSGGWLWPAALASISLALIAGGYWSYRGEAEEIRQDFFRSLTTIAELRGAEISHWRRERLAAVRRTAGSPIVRRAVEKWIEGPQTAGLRDDCRKSLEFERDATDDDDVVVVATDGHILFAASADPDEAQPATRRAIDAAIDTHQPALSNLYVGRDRVVRIDSAIPIQDASGRDLAVLVLRTRADAHLYPLILSWPTASRTAETLLVMRDGNEVVFLNELRHQHGTALTLRVPITRADVPAVQAVLGKSGRITGTDYRGEQVLADVRAIPASPWSMVTKVDDSEILAEARSRAWVIALVVAAFIAVNGTMIVLVHRHRQALLYSQMYKAERAERQALSALGQVEAEQRAILDNLPVGVAVNSTEPGVSFRYMNDNFPAFYRTTREQLQDDDAFWRAVYEEPEFRDALRRRVLEDCASGDPQRMCWTDIPLRRKGAETAYVTARNIPLPGRGLWISTVWDVTERKRAEEALRTSEERHRKLFDEATEGIILADAASGEILDCNRAFLQLTEYDLQDLVGKHQSILHPNEDGNPAVTRAFAEHRSDKGGAVLETDLLTRRGGVKRVEIKANLVEVGGRLMLQGFFRDISAERRRHRERETTLALMRLLNADNSTHELLHDLTALIHDWAACEAVGVRLQDGDDFPYYETRGFPARFVQAENSLCTPDECGKPLRDGQGYPILECMCGNVLRGRFNADLPFFTPKGSFWTNSTSELLATTSDGDRQARTRNRCNGEGYESVALFALRHGAKVLGLLQVNDHRRDRFTPETIAFLEGLADQIALALAQREAQARLRESEHFNREVIAGARDGIVVYDREFRYRVWNPFMADLTGLPASEVLGKVAIDLFPHLRENSLDELLRQALAGDTVETADVQFHVPSTGRSGWYSAVYSPHRDPHGAIIGVIGIVRDRTERKRAETERQLLETQLRQAQKMESVGRLAGGVAHDFNNILTVILGYSELILNRLPPSDPLHQDLQEILAAGRRSAELTRQLLAFARRQTIQPKILDLNAAIENTLKMLRRLIGEDIELVWSPGADLWPVLIDPAQLDQILANLP